MTARSVKNLARGLLALIVLGVIAGVLMADAAFGWSRPAHFVAFYALTACAFVAFPRTRRSDIAQLTVLSAVLGEAARWLLRHDAEMPDLIADLLGIGFVYVTSYAEQLRSTGRAAPHGPALQRRRNDKRKRLAAPAATLREQAVNHGAAPISDAAFTVVEEKAEDGRRV